MPSGEGALSHHFTPLLRNEILNPWGLQRLHLPPRDFLGIGGGVPYKFPATLISKGLFKTRDGISHITSHGFLHFQRKTL